MDSGEGMTDRAMGIPQGTLAAFGVSSLGWGGGRGKDASSPHCSGLSPTLESTPHRVAETTGATPPGARPVEGAALCE